MPLWLDRLRDRLTNRGAFDRPLATEADTLPRPSGPVLWIHDPVPGNDGAVRALIAALDEAHGGLTFLVTGPSGPDTAGSDMPHLLRQPAPQDGPRPGQAFLDHWQPDLALIFATGLPAALIAEADRRALPLYLICDPAHGPLPRGLLRRFRHVFATTADLAGMLRKQGIAEARIEVTGDLCATSPPPPCNETERDNLARLLAGRPSWLAASTSPAEDLTVVAAQAAAARRAHRLLLILVPDDAARGSDLAHSLRREGWRVALRSADEEPEEETQIFVADTEGEMGLWYRLAPISFLGGSLDPQAGGGIDPAPAAGLGSAILHGPRTDGHDKLYARLDAAMAARTVRDAPGLARMLATLIAPEKAAELAHNAWEVSSAGAETTDRITTRLLADLDGGEAG
ncbi:3-deoxy-D-manno-octulosonic acid transferase [Actibacterium sp. D379-3]